MKSSISIFIIAFSLQVAMAQEQVGRKEITIEDPWTRTPIKIKTGSKVAVLIKEPNVRKSGIILNLSDSAMILGHGKQLEFVPFNNLESISLVPLLKKRFIATVIFENGVKLKGELIRMGPDSLGIMPSRAPRLSLKAFEIKSIEIRGKGHLGKSMGFGAITGGSIGAIIGHGNYDSNAAQEIILDAAEHFGSILEGAVIGGLTGFVAGTLIGLRSKKYEIDGNQVRFDQFTNAYADYALNRKTR